MLQQASEVIMYSRKLALDLNRHTLDLNNNCQQDFGGVGDVKLLVPPPPPPPPPLLGVSRTTVGGNRGGEGGPSTEPPTNWSIHGMYANPSNLHHHQHVLSSSPSPSLPLPLPLPHHNHHLEEASLLPLPPQPTHPYLHPMATAAAVGFLHQQQRHRGGGGHASWLSNWQEVFQGVLVAQKGGAAMEAAAAAAPEFQYHQKLPHQSFILPRPSQSATATATATATAFITSMPIPSSKPLRSDPPAPSQAPPSTGPPPSAHLNQVKREEGIATTVPAPAPSPSPSSLLHSAIHAQALSTAQAMRSSDSAALQTPKLPPQSPPRTPTIALSNHFVKGEEEERCRSGDGDGDGAFSPPSTDPDTPSTPTEEVIITKYTIKSPSWLPEGWVTEVQTRRTGTTAGTRDKYYKDLISGRRFRSRNEVIHFLSTGKGRIRRRHRGRKLISNVAAATVTSGTALTIGGNSFNQRLECAEIIPYIPPCQQSMDFVVGPSMNTPTGQGSFPLPQLPPISAPVAEEIPSSSVQPNVLVPTSTSIQPPISPIGLKRIAPQESPQKLLSKKKPKNLSSPKEIANKQASRLWQWLQKPAPKSNHEPCVLAMNSDKIDSNTEKLMTQLPERLERKSMEELERGIRAAQRTVQLGREIQSAQRIVMQLGREMQTTVEKLGHGIQAVQRTTETGIEDTFSKDFVLGTEREATRRANEAMCNVIQAAQTIDVAMENVIQAAERIDGAMGNIIHASQKLDVAMGNVIQASQISESATCTTPLTGETMSNNNPPQRSDFNTSTGDVIQMAPRSLDNVTKKTLFPSVEHGINASQRPNCALGFAFQGSQEPPIFAMSNGLQISQGPYLVTNNVYPATQMADSARMCTTTSASLMPILTMGNVAQTDLIPITVGNMAAHMQPLPQITPVTNPIVIQPPVKIPFVKPIDNQIPNGSVCALVDVKHTKIKTENLETYLPDLMPPLELKPPPEEIKQIVEVRPRHESSFSILNPKFDLTRICPNMTSRQRAKMVQKLKARYARGLLAILGRHLCLMALGSETGLNAISSKANCQNSTHKFGIRNTAAWAQEAALYDVLKECLPEFDQFSDNEDGTDDESDES